MFTQLALTKLELEFLINLSNSTGQNKLADKLQLEYDRQMKLLADLQKDREVKRR